VFYSGLVYLNQGLPFETVHQRVYTAVRQDIPPDKQSYFLNENDFRTDLAGDATHFAQMFPYYSVKPLFVMAGMMAFRILPFLNVMSALTLVSVVSYVLTASIVWRWIGASIGDTHLRFAVCTLIAWLPDLLAAARRALPDMLATALIVSGIYLIAQSGRMIVGGGLLVLSVWTRPDSLVLAIMLFGLFIFRRRLEVLPGVILAGLAAGSYFVILHFAGSYGWEALFRITFQGGMSAFQTAPVPISARMYLSQFPTQLLRISGANLPLYVLLCIVCIARARERTSRDLCFVMLAGSAVRLLLYPNFEERYFLAPYIICAVLGILAALGTGKSSSSTPSHEFRTGFQPKGLAEARVTPIG